jgi:hypothetical protein
MIECKLPGVKPSNFQNTMFEALQAITISLQMKIKNAKVNNA